MSLLIQRLQGSIVALEWTATSSGIAASGGTNQFLSPYSSNANPSTTESGGQRRAGVAFQIWRLVAAFTRGTPTSQATVTARINGVSQASTATVIGTALGSVITDVASSILVASTDLLSTLFVTTSTDTGTTHPCAQIIGCLCSTF